MDNLRVPSICPVRRSKSFPNESETTDHAAELEDFLSSRSGVTELSMDKPESDEEEEHWKDASPVTPTCSPMKHSPRLSPEGKPSKTIKVEVHDFQPASPLHEKDVVIVDSSATPPSNKMAMMYSRQVITGIEKVVPKVKLKREPVVDSEEMLERMTETNSQPPLAVEKPPDGERRKNLGRTSRDALNDVDTVEQDVKKKMFRKKDQDGRRSLKKKVDETEEPSAEASKAEADDSRKKKEERKSLREQECIERVTEFLTKHCMLTYSDLAPSHEQEMGIESSDESIEQRITRPSSFAESHEVPDEAVSKQELVKTEKEPTFSIKIEELAKTPSSMESEEHVAVSANVAVGTGAAEPNVSVVSPDTEISTTKRRSSMRKRPGPFSRESSRESLLDDTKKEVRIQENVEEIFFEDTSEQLTGILPEVQLVKARIITAEEVVANRVEESMKIEVHSPPEVTTVSDSVRVRTGRVPSPETVNMSQLQLLSLAKSTSENALVDTSDRIDDENKISLKNIKAEILLDLSKVKDVGEDEESIDDERKDKKLSRTGSEGSKRSGSKAQARFRERDGFKIGSLARPDEPELTILPENSIVDRRKNIEDDRDSLVDYGVEKVIKRSEDQEAEVETVSRLLLTDQEAELPARKPLAIEKGEEEKEPGRSPEASYDRVLWQQRRPLLEETVRLVSEEDGSLISKEHSLEYQSQTLESQQSAHPLLSTSLESLLRLAIDSWPIEQLDSGAEESDRSFKETQYSPKEKQDAETQTEQETKSTQCSPEQSIVSPSEISKESSLHLTRRYHQSPRREVETQTQGESKSVQCCLDELGSLTRTQDSEDSYDSPSRSKSVQCIPEDISRTDGLGKSLDSEAEVNGQKRRSRSPRREVEVQTYQESKAIQCSDDELLEVVSGQIDNRSEAGKSRKRESSSSSSSGSPCKLPTLVFVEERTDMTVTQRDHEGNVNWSKHWGPERLVEIYREPKTSLGLSIVGGKVDLHNGSSSKSQNISGIFIKNVLPNSPAGKTGELKTGDRIIEVDGVDLRHSTHERAVEVIQAAGNPVCLLVQSLVHLNNEHDAEEEERRQNGRSRLSDSPTASIQRKASSVSPVRSDRPEVIQGGTAEVGKQGSSKSDFRRQSKKDSDGAGSSSRRSSMKKSIRKKAPSPPSNPGILREVSEEKEDNVPKPAEPPRRKYSSDESSEEDTRELEGNVYTKAGMEISRKSAGNVKRSKAEIEADPEQEDEFGYTNMKVQKKYHSLGHKVLLIKVEKDRRGLGISLAGHKDRNRMAVFVCGLNPKGNAHKVGEILVGDEILEVNGCVLQGRCHLNASALIKGMAGTCFKIVVLRRSSALNDLAVKPIAQFPPTLDDSEMYKQYKGVRNIPVKKGQYGLGIMIIEGKHAEVGQGIFISDIQEGSAAEQAGLQVGDLILAVNMDCLLGSTYDEATSLLKKAEGVVTLTVCNPNQKKVAKEEEDRAKGIIPEPAASAGGTSPSPSSRKEPEKPPEPEPPQDPKDCKIVPGRDTTIEFQKDKDKGIGFIIAGGSDTPLKGVFIVEVFPDGAADKDGRLQAGDQILDMCGQSFKEMEHDNAHAAVLKASGTITMVVHRHEKAEEEIDVELQKKSGKGVGLCLTGYKSGKGAYVSDLLPGGSALESGKICKGDRVVAVGGQDVRESPVGDIAVHVKISNPVQLKLARFTSAKQ